MTSDERGKVVADFDLAREFITREMEAWTGSEDIRAALAAVERLRDRALDRLAASGGDAEDDFYDYPNGEAAKVCAEVYQVVGSLLSDVGAFDSEQGQKVLDNLSEHRLVHKDVLPWPSLASPPPAAEQGANPAAWQYRHWMIGGQWSAWKTALGADELVARNKAASRPDLYEVRALFPPAAALGEEDGPGAEDGPWAEGFAERAAIRVTDEMVERACRAVVLAEGNDPDEPVKYAGTNRLARNPDGSKWLQWETRKDEVRTALLAALGRGEGS